VPVPQPASSTHSPGRGLNASNVTRLSRATSGLAVASYVAAHRSYPSRTPGRFSRLAIAFRPSDAAVQRRRAALASAARAHNATTRSRRARDAVWIVPVHEAAICRSAREPRLTAEVPITTFRTTERTVFHAPCSRCEWTASYHVHSRWPGATLRLRCLGPRMLTRRPTAQR
jgi:hypothetical protein